MKPLARPPFMNAKTRPPAPDHAVLELDRFLPYRLSVLSNRISQDIAALYGRKRSSSSTAWSGAGGRVFAFMNGGLANGFI
jgi:hypothetical protein